MFWRRYENAMDLWEYLCGRAAVQSEVRVHQLEDWDS